MFDVAFLALPQGRTRTLTSHSYSALSLEAAGNITTTDCGTDSSGKIEHDVGVE
jgi:hypothetical protein